MKFFTQSAKCIIVAAGLLMVTSCNNANNSNDVATQAPVAGIQSKYQNNGYLTQESFNADQAKLQQMQVDAQNYLSKLQRDAQNEMQQYNIQLNDSIESFIKYYAKQNGYDMILYKASSVYVDPKYDVTNDVVEGLNKRYTKVEKK